MVLRFASIAALVWLLAARALGPSDLWDQTQPKTVSYTTDMLVHGGSHWILPIERGELGATKPPLYNWVAAPFVRLAGFSSEIAHKFPSILAVCACWLVIVRLGRMLDPHEDGALGWLAGIAFVSNYTIFKLGYLARPDMLLTLWLVLAWACATALFVRGETDQPRKQQVMLVLGFWLCVGLAALTKGPPALAAVLYAVFAAKFVGGSWRCVHRLRWWWGMPLAFIMGIAWPVAVWSINPEHVRSVLLGDEILGRVTGTGPEGGQEGLRGWVLTFFNQAVYYLVRFLPWSLPSIAGVWSALRADNRESTVERGTPDQDFYFRLSIFACLWLRGAAVFVIVVVLMFSLSAGKRADYIAAAFGPGSLLAAWWLLRSPYALSLRWKWLVPCLALLTLATMTVVNQLQPTAPVRNFGPAIARFINEAESAIQAEPRPVVLYSSGETQLQAMLGLSQADSPREITQRIRANETFWVIARRRYKPPYDYGQWLMDKRRVRAEAVVRSEDLPHDRGWPQQLTLYRISPER